MMGLSDGRKSFPIGLAVLTQYRSVTATQPASHVAVAITLYAKASSAKMSITLLIRFFLNIARWDFDFDYFGGNKYLYYILSIK